MDHQTEQKSWVQSWWGDIKILSNTIYMPHFINIPHKEEMEIHFKRNLMNYSLNEALDHLELLGLDEEYCNSRSGGPENSHKFYKAPFWPNSR